MSKSIKKLSFIVIAFLCMIVLAGCTEPTPTGAYTSDTYNWVTPETDKLKLTEDFVGKDFIQDGIGEVSQIVRHVDGDTTVFKTKAGAEVTVRYNGINTPESTYRIEPWGHSASKKNKDIFKNALEQGAKIVLTTEDIAHRFDTTNVRYLAWVWLVYPNGDSRLVNLELAELGYALVKSASGTQYEEQFNQGMYNISLHKLRVYGEKDPNFDYSTEAQQMTIRQIRETYGTEEAVNTNTGVSGDGSFVSPLIKITGIVAKKNGDRNAYIQQYDAENNKYYGIYVYGGFNNITKLHLGCAVEITGKIGYYYGSLQITDISTDNQIKLLSGIDLDQIVVRDETIANIDNIYAYSNIGSLVTLHNLTCYGYSDSQNNSATTLKCHYIDENNNEKQFNIRIAKEVALYDEFGQQILSGEYFVGKKFKNVTGMVAYYNGGDKDPYSEGHIQLALSTMDDVVFE